MPLSEQQIALHQREATYKGDESFVGLAIQDKELHTVSGPSGLQKTTILRRLTDIYPGTALAHILTDRERKDGDPFSFLTRENGVNLEDIQEMIRDGRVVNYAISPATGRTFATVPESFPAAHNYLPLLTTNLEQINQADFARTTNTYLVMASLAWKAQILETNFRGFRKLSMNENVASIYYALDHIAELKFVKRHKKNHDKTVNELAAVTISDGPGRDQNIVEDELQEMLKVAKSFAIGTSE